MFKKIALGCVALALGSGIMAHTGATGIVKERMDGMSKLSAAMKTVLSETQSASPRADAIKQAAQVMQAHAGEEMTKRFPEGSMDHPSEASEAIWQNWDRFAFLAEQLDLHARGLEMAAGNPITGKPAILQDNRLLMDFATMGPDEVFTLLGQNCTACHKEFRVKKK